MPIPFVAHVVQFNYDHVILHWKSYVKFLVTLAAIGGFKFWSMGRSTTWERKMNGMVVIVTGGTSGIGKRVVEKLALLGAHVVILVRSEPDQFTVDYIMDLRNRSNNQFVYSEVCDLSSMLSVRKFATQWIDCSPIRRLDMIVLCGGLSLPPYIDRQVTTEGVELQWATNFLGPYQLMRLLRPVIYGQPGHREVRIVAATCSSYVLGDINFDDLALDNHPYPRSSPWKVVGNAKLAFMTCLYDFQKKAQNHERPDKMPCNIHTVVVNPGIVRTPGFRRFISFGRIWGLFLYLLLWPFWWLLLKGTLKGAQSFFHAICSPEFGATTEYLLVNECTMIPPSRKEIADPEYAEKLIKAADAQIDLVEKQYKKKGASKTNKK
ncbi:short chain dehydrogenase [Schizosaccharomyces cryophilus OY26]|uniref:Short chain dehydrogenase n=1 Tax=Schizosaccharomyces cryophilus (strain OY26 / ATCC MYA-4695 / CBS 11777 / NBRC 106824 / NRRL Y48691) TaxID=653667 RepID=S9XFH4_SCHCR|nr:short chain dehydrogenase [Schizosaccharomyces cryophilus OY26]EPY52361.1 short chain dehydrogenase [Schizosaccharomyces cryophilus OY26]